MLFRGQQWRMFPILEPEQRPREERDRGNRLRKGLRLSLKSRKRWIFQGRQMQRQSLILQIGQGHGSRTKQGRGQRSPGLMPRIRKRYILKPR